MKYRIDLDVEKCASCGACAIACMDQNDYDVSCGFPPFRKVFENERIVGSSPVFEHYSIACMHCDDAACIPACPAGCIKKDPGTGFTVYDNTNCIGCRSCAMACPFGAPTFNSAGKMEKCDGCYVRVSLGMEPACVKICPTKALRLLTDEEYRKEKTAASLGERCEEITVPAVKI
ncbi:MAG: 4Fe-4S dicluster domain-containing protein [Oscillospiraceae bacterium]|nr:4Fe-4S dicluster domain-containing protein [Oscillospiraceae bacterium]